MSTHATLASNETLQVPRGTAVWSSLAARTRRRCRRPSAASTAGPGGRRRSLEYLPTEIRTQRVESGARASTGRQGKLDSPRGDSPRRRSGGVKQLGDSRVGRHRPCALVALADSCVRRWPGAASARSTCIADNARACADFASGAGAPATAGTAGSGGEVVPSSSFPFPSFPFPFLGSRVLPRCFHHCFPDASLFSWPVVPEFAVSLGLFAAEALMLLEARNRDERSPSTS
jgi:hypothetical protein